MTEALSAVSNIATAIGVAVAAYQLFVARRQAMTAFEDSLNAQYRVLVAPFPVEALFGEALHKEKVADLLPHFYRYFDLCNEQAFLYSRRRVSHKTWQNWEEGIRSNLGRPAFAAAWSEVARRAVDDFNHLRTLCPPGQSAEVK